PIVGRQQQDSGQFQFADLPTSLGTVSGTIELSEAPTFPPSPGRHYYAFRGIPYVAPPVGDLRWEAPQELSGPLSGGRLDATHFRAVCPQFDPDTDQVVGDEDCLYLNVYTPFLPGESQERLPVLVFLHGGSYMRGSANSHGAQRLMREDIIVVTVGYRLGALGFLSTGESTIPGNYGLLDQVAALQWVQRHIQEFGGEPSRVTLGGFASGASATHLHTLSPLSRGLFQSAIMMSGAGNCVWSVAHDPYEAAMDLAYDLECSTWSYAAMRECLMGKSYRQLIQAQAKEHKFVLWPMLYRPIVDKYLRDNPFLPEPLHVLMASPPPVPMPLLLGGSSYDGLIFALNSIIFSEAPGSPSQIYEEATHYTLRSMWPNVTADPAVADVVAEVLKTYYYSPQAKDNINTLLDEMTQAFTDMFFTSCIWDAAAHMAASSRAPVYTYVMGYHE
ncbi:unnamed protein product, partial [Meganyctiphanes norvegica]